MTISVKTALRSSLYLLVVVGSLLLLGIGTSGCSQESAKEVLNSQELNGRIVKLQQGASIKAVKAELGEPGSEFIATEGEKESSLRYGVWQLLFNRRGLERRLRQHRSERQVVVRLTNAFDAKVLELRRGMSIAVVKSKLGRPEYYEEAFEGGPVPEKILRYGPWEMTFDHGKLRMRTQF